MSRWRRQQQKRARRGALATVRRQEVDALKYVPVLARMMHILKQDRTVPFGVAMNRAMMQLGLNVPKHMVGPLLRSAFKLVTGATASRAQPTVAGRARSTRTET